MNREPEQRDDEAEIWAEEDGIDVMTDYSWFDDLSGVIRLLKSGNKGDALIKIAVAELEKVASDPKRMAKVANRRKVFDRDRDIVNAFETRLECFPGFEPTTRRANPRSAELLAEELAATHGFSVRGRFSTF